MTNNDILRRLRYTFEINDSQMIEIFAFANLKTTRAEISTWLKKEDHEDYEELIDKNLAYFLNGFIIYKRGKQEGKEIVTEETLNNNIIFRKLKIALTLKDEDILQILKTVDFKLSRHELSAFFRNPKQSQYRECKQQILRNFLHGLQEKYHIASESN